MMTTIQSRRLLWLALLVVLAYCGLGWRLLDLQYLSAGEQGQAQAMSVLRETVEIPRRGDILDRNGDALTVSVPVFNIGTEPPRLSPHQARVAAVLAGPLGKDARELTRLLTPTTNWTADGRARVNTYAMLKRGLSSDEWNALEKLVRTNNFGFDLQTLSKSEKETLKVLRQVSVQVESQEQLRTYPYGAVGGQILGIVRSRTNQYSLGKRVLEPVGHTGVERAFNAQLAGGTGFRRLVQSGPDAPVEEKLPPTDGWNVVLTIDRRLQEVLDENLAQARTNLGAAAVFGVIMDVQTGATLAMSSAPLFAPGDRKNFEPAHAHLRPIIDEFEPGSIFKVVAVSGALEDQVVSLETPIDCHNGHLPVPGSRPLKDEHGGYDVLTVKGIVTKSSNIGTAEIVRRLGHDRFYHWMRQFGVGSRTGIGLAEGAGSLRDRRAIYPVEFTRLPIGYGLRVTQLQLAAMYAAVANGGLLLQPRLITRLESRDGRVISQFEPSVVRRVLSEEAARKMTEALMTVATPDGTAKEAALEHYQVAGKTGTAHKWNTKTRPPSYDNEHYYASFVGFFPASAPRLCIAITVDEPSKGDGHAHFGGRAAAPVFRKVATEAAHLLNLRPDRLADDAARPPMSAPASASAPVAAPVDHAYAATAAPVRPSAPGGLRLSVANPPQP